MPYSTPDLRFEKGNKIQFFLPLSLTISYLHFNRNTTFQRKLCFVQVQRKYRIQKPRGVRSLGSASNISSRERSGSNDAFHQPKSQMVNSTRSYFSERIVFRFRKDIHSKSEKGWGFDILCMRIHGVRGICTFNAPPCTALICPFARA